MPKLIVQVESSTVGRAHHGCHTMCKFSAACQITGAFGSSKNHNWTDETHTSSKRMCVCVCVFFYLFFVWRGRFYGIFDLAVLMDSRKEKEAITELSRAIAFKADLHLLHLRAAFHEHIGDVSGALRDCRAALSVEPNHQEMLELHSRVNSQEPWENVHF